MLSLVFPYRYLLVKVNNVKSINWTMKKLNPKHVTLFNDNIENELELDFDIEFQFIEYKKKDTIEVYVKKDKKVKGLF
jgi:hypothetical protein